MVLTVVEFLVNTRSRELPALWVGGVTVRVRSNEARREIRQEDWEGSGKLKSPSRIMGVPSSGKELSSMSISS